MQTRLLATMSNSTNRKIFITGSSDGIGRAAASLLAQQGHSVYLHARSTTRAKEAEAAVPGAAGVIVGDISTISGMRALAQEANAAGPFDTIVHNAGLGPSNSDTKTEDGLASTFAVNSLAPYVLTALMERKMPSAEGRQRLLYLSSSSHYGGSDDLTDMAWRDRKGWNSFQAYGDSKLQNVLLANAIARRWGDAVQSCSLDPGWVKTKMGGQGAPGTTDAPARAIAAYAAGEKGLVGDDSGVYFDPSGKKTPHQGTLKKNKQDDFVRICEEISGVKLPTS